MIKIEIEKYQSLNALHFNEENPLLLIPCGNINKNTEKTEKERFISRKSAKSLSILNSLAEEYGGLAFINIARDFYFLNASIIDLVYILDNDKKNEISIFFERAMKLGARYSFPHIINNESQEKFKQEYIVAHQKFKEKGLDFIVEKIANDYILNPTRDRKYRLKGYMPIRIKLVEYKPLLSEHALVKNDVQLKYCTALFGVI